MKNYNLKAKICWLIEEKIGIRVESIVSNPNISNIPIVALTSALIAEGMDGEDGVFEEELEVVDASEVADKDDTNAFGIEDGLELGGADDEDEEGTEPAPLFVDSEDLAVSCRLLLIRSIMCENNAW